MECAAVAALSHPQGPVRTATPPAPRGIGPEARPERAEGPTSLRPVVCKFESAATYVFSFLLSEGRDGLETNAFR